MILFLLAVLIPSDGADMLPGWIGSYYIVSIGMWPVFIAWHIYIISTIIVHYSNKKYRIINSIVLVIPLMSLVVVPGIVKAVADSEASKIRAKFTSVLDLKNISQVYEFQNKILFSRKDSGKLFLLGSLESSKTQSDTCNFPFLGCCAFNCAEIDMCIHDLILYSLDTDSLKIKIEATDSIALKSWNGRTDNYLFKGYYLSKYGSYNSEWLTINLEVPNKDITAETYTLQGYSSQKYEDDNSFVCHDGHKNIFFLFTERDPELTNRGFAHFVVRNGLCLARINSNTKEEHVFKFELPGIPVNKATACFIWDMRFVNDYVYLMYSNGKIYSNGKLDEHISETNFIGPMYIIKIKLPETNL